MNKFQLFRATLSDQWFDFKNQVRAFFTPSDYTREMFSTVSRGYVAWMAFVILINFFSGMSSLFDSQWNEGFLYMIVSALFFIMFWDQMILNMARRTIESLLGVARDQNKMLNEMLDDELARSSGISRGEEFD
jgi:hypothetical protein